MEHAVSCAGRWREKDCTCGVTLRKENATLKWVIAIVRQHPDFDDGGPLAEMMDEVLAGKYPELLNTMSKWHQLVTPNEKVQGQDEAQLRTVPLERPVGRRED